MNSGYTLPFWRAKRRAEIDTLAPDVVDDLIALSLRGLPHMYRSEELAFAQTVRRNDEVVHSLVAEGENPRYAAIVALGTAHLDIDSQRELFSGATGCDLVQAAAKRVVAASDLGAVALVAWATAEVCGSASPELIAQLSSVVRSSTPAPTVDLSWTLTAMVAADTSTDPGATELLAERIMAAQGRSGIFPHMLPRESLGRYRSHVGCFADQVYPIQALSRYFAATGDGRALAAANRCADKIVELQGAAGQWWWHYDARTGRVVEGYPVYSVHQHAMGPMALFELGAVGGHDHLKAIVLGLDWLRTHPETTGELIDADAGVVWRKVGRREPRKLTRAVRATTTAVHPSLRLGWLDRVLVPGPIDFECRPYELGWLLYAWASEPVAARPAAATHQGAVS